MLFEPKNFDNILGLKGFSDIMLKNHFTLYQGYVNNTNKLIDTLNILIKEGKVGAPEFAELKRRFGWEFNGMRLHESYFGNMANPVASLSAFQTSSEKGENALDKSTNFFKKLVGDFSSYENWEHEFKSVGAMRGIGWVVLYYDPSAKRLFNCWINEHDAGHLADATPLLVMDVFEHAYMTDYGIKRADYIESFMNAIDWGVVAARFERASK